MISWRTYNNISIYDRDTRSEGIFGSAYRSEGQKLDEHSEHDLTLGIQFRLLQLIRGRPRAVKVLSNRDQSWHDEQLGILTTSKKALAKLQNLGDVNDWFGMVLFV